MYTRILVALDGSPLAEQVLPHVEALAQRFDSTLILLRTVPPPTALFSDAAGALPVAGAGIDPVPLIEAERQDAAAYLEAIAGRLRGQGIAVECDTPDGPAAATIVDRAAELGVDLIAMTTHGRSGLGRLLFGSVADAVLRHAPCPVLLVRARGAPAPQA